MKTVFTFIATALCSLSITISTAHAEYETLKGAKADLQTFKKEMSDKLALVDQQLAELKRRHKIKART